jgi:hypothetical protein
VYCEAHFKVNCGLKGRLAHCISTIPLQHLEKKTSLVLPESDQFFFTGQILKSFLFKPLPPVGGFGEKVSITIKSNLCCFFMGGVGAV